MATLKQLREDMALSQSELAELAGVAKTTVVKVETNQRKPHPKTRRKLAKALKVKPNEIEF